MIPTPPDEAESSDFPDRILVLGKRFEHVGSGKYADQLTLLDDRERPDFSFDQNSDCQNLVYCDGGPEF